ncbi:elongator complex protein 5 [Palaemon carinicauda]|uniref:elongator complex protein 5 n=1 Tax=Palaemon carinicauda TaxID=392227 RepID=UPI0035B69FAC
MTKAILGKIIHKCESFSPRLILITDSSQIHGRGVVLSLVKSHLRTNTEVHYLTTALSPARIKSYIESEGLASKVTFFDGYSDASGWKNTASCVHLHEPLEELFTVGTVKGSSKYVVVIDKIDDAINHQDSSKLIKSLHKISLDENVEQLIVYASSDCVQENVMSALCHLASATIHLQAAVPYKCRIVLKKPSGKVLQSCEEFNLGPDLTVQDNRTVEIVKHQPEETSDADAILAAQTTFNLTLTEDQRKSKNMLLLPHTRVQSSGGQILYTPDDVDDWDEEDPDDDLDI